MNVHQRVEGLGRAQLYALKDRCNQAIEEIEEGGKVDIWVVSDDAVNLYWDISYDRACHYLAKELHSAIGAVTKFSYELSKQRIFANEVKRYKDDYGQTWASVQAEMDAVGSGRPDDPNQAISTETGRVLSIDVKNAHTLADFVNASEPGNSPIDALHKCIDRLAEYASVAKGQS